MCACVFNFALKHEFYHSGFGYGAFTDAVGLNNASAPVREIQPVAQNIVETQNFGSRRKIRIGSKFVFGGIEHENVVLAQFVIDGVFEKRFA